MANKQEVQDSYDELDRICKDLDDCLQRSDKLLAELKYLTDKCYEYMTLQNRKALHNKLLWSEGVVLRLKEFFRSKRSYFFGKRLNVERYLQHLK